jgi:tetratricopeptide (TPR) repeat protein
MSRNWGSALALILIAGPSMLSAADLGAAAKPKQVELSRGYEAFFNNEYDEALSYFKEQAKIHPDEAEQYNHIAQTILYRELFRNGSLESQLVSGNNAFLRRPKVEISSSDRQLFANNINQAIAICERRLKDNPRDAKTLYELGVAHGLRSNYSFLVEKAWSDALHEASAARKAQEQVLELDPKFVDARLILGVYQYVVASLPFYLRAVGFLSGFHGSREGGFEQLELVASQGHLNQYDSKVVLAALYRREHKPGKAIPLLEELAQRFPRNYLLRFEQVQMYSDLGDKTSALRVLDGVEELRRTGSPGYACLAAEKVHYVAGNLHFWYRDLDLALADLQQVARRPDVLDLNAAVMTWLRLGQIYDMRSDRQDAISAYREAIKTAPNSDVAAEAKRYISSPYQRKDKQNG